MVAKATVSNGPTHPPTLPSDSHNSSQTAAQKLEQLLAQCGVEIDHVTV
jgi:hypothetical protein